MPGGAELNKEVHTSRTSCAPVHKAIPGQIVSVEPWMTNKEVLMPLETWRSGGGEARSDGREATDQELLDMKKRSVKVFLDAYLFRERAREDIA